MYMFPVSSGLRQVFYVRTWPRLSSVLHFDFSFLFCRDINKTVHSIWNANGSQVTSKEGSIIKLTECQWQKSAITRSACH